MHVKEAYTQKQDTIRDENRRLVGRPLSTAAIPICLEVFSRREY
jgi:hypothetical protein